MSKRLTSKECLEALAQGKALQHIDCKGSVRLSKDGLVDERGETAVFTFPNGVYTILEKPKQTVALTEEKILHEYEQHIIGIGNGKASRDEKVVNFIKALGFTK